MQEVLRTNDAVLLSFAQHVLAEAEVETLVLDAHMSVMEGSIGALPRRLMVAADDLARARAALDAAGLGAMLYREA
jgi:Putative prokaryotic signal transducing protein